MTDYSTWQVELKTGTDTRIDNAHKINNIDGDVEMYDRDGKLIFMAPRDSISYMKCLQKPVKR